MHPYILILLCSAACCAALFSARLRRNALPGKLALTALLLSAALGFALAKGVYVFSLASRLFPRHGIGAFIRMQPDEFSFVGGSLGVILGVVLACRIHHVSMLPVLDAFAPVMALLMAFARGGEYFLGMQGVGEYMENESLYFFPLAVQNEWGEYFLAVFMLSAIFALLVAVAALFTEKKTRDVPGLLFELVLYHLALSQILGETLRVQCMKWGFVRTEQLYCAVICLLLLIRSCCAYPRKAPVMPAAAAGEHALALRDGQLPALTQAPKPSFLRRFWPIAAFLICAGVLICMEFALDGKIPMAAVYCYTVMLLTLCAMSALAMITARRRVH